MNERAPLLIMILQIKHDNQGWESMILHVKSSAFITANWSLLTGAEHTTGHHPELQA